MRIRDKIKQYRTHSTVKKERIMEYRRFNDQIIARIDRGEEILEQIKAIADREDIKLAMVNALGAVDDFTAGVYNVAEKQYKQNRFTGFHEITSLHGSINTMGGEFYTHIHISAANEQGQVFGGHLNRAVVGATCEMFITLIDGRVDRVRDEELGINLLEF